MWTSRQNTPGSDAIAGSAQLVTVERRLFVRATVPSLPFSDAPSTMTGPQNRSSPPVVGAPPSMVSIIHPPVFGSAIGSKLAEAISEQLWRPQLQIWPPQLP